MTRPDRRRLCTKVGVLMKIDKTLMSGSTTLLILSLLSGGEMYGYEIITELAERSDKTFELKEGTLYPLLHGLERDRYVESFEKASPQGRMRKYYRITKKGRGLLEEKEKEWNLFSQKVNQVVYGFA